jgi:hypothetical protein
MSQPLYFPRSIAAYGSADFEATLKQEIEALDAGQLPLIKGMTTGNYVVSTRIQAMILAVTISEDIVHVKAGIFFSSILAGCSCADDPTPVEESNEYCELLFEIDRATAAATVELVS